MARAAAESVPGEIDDDMAILVVRCLPAELDARERVFPAEPVMVSEARRMAQETFQAWGMDHAQTEVACLLVSEVVTNAVLHTSAAAGPRREFGDFGVEPDGAGGPGGAARAGSSAGPSAPRANSSVSPPSGARVPGGSVAALSAPPMPWDIPVPVMRTGQAFPAEPKDFALRLRRGASAVWVEVFDADMRLPRIRSAEESDEGGRGLYLVEQLATRWGSRPTRNGKAVWFEMPMDSQQA
jgi:anti-sigma regulatory factor (Ser/Thr protein kinase)